MGPMYTNNAPASSQELRQTQQSSRKNVTNACVSCQKRKKKCDGNQPCQNCVQSHIDCDYSAEDHRRKNAVKRKYEEYQRDHELLGSLLTTIRDSQDEQVSQVVSLIRSNASFEEVKACMSDHLDQLRRNQRQPTPEFEGLRRDCEVLEQSRVQAPEALNRKRKDILQINRIVDEPLYRIRPTPWTSVTDDDDLVSNLISVWRTWDSPFYDFLDTNLFLRDLQAEELNSKFCSPFLVNCILAIACPYSDYTEARTKNGSVSELMKSFLEESKQLLTQELQRPALLTLTQGLTALHIALAVVGQDKPGYANMLQAIKCCHELQRQRSDLMAACESRAAAAELSRSIDKTCWGIFNHTNATALAFMRPQTMDSPQVVKLHFLESLSSEPAWKPYPLQGTLRPSYQDDIHNSLRHIAKVSAALSKTLFDGPLLGKEQKVEELYEMLLEHLASLPDELKPRKDSSVSLFIHSAWIQVVILRMFLPFKHPTATKSSSTQRKARDICTDAVLQVAYICKLHMQSYGCVIMNVVFTQSVSLALFAILEEPDITNYHPQIIDLCICLRSLSRRWPMAMGLMRMVQLTARKSGLVLPRETDKLFNEFEVSWEETEELQFSSIFPDPQSTISADPGTSPKQDMGKFLESMADLHLEDSSQSTDTAGVSARESADVDGL